MDLIKIMKPDFVCNDNRGLLVQISREGFKQVNAVFSKAEKVRGNFHYHKINEETFYIISGKVKVTVELEDQKEEHIFLSGNMFMIKKNVRHKFEYLEDSYLVVLYNNGVELENDQKDIYYD